MRIIKRRGGYVCLTELFFIEFDLQHFLSHEEYEELKFRSPLPCKRTHDVYDHDDRIREMLAPDKADWQATQKPCEVMCNIHQLRPLRN